MPFDVVAFYEAAAVQTFAVNVTPVPDQFYHVAGDYLYPQKAAPYLAGVFFSGVSTPARCRVFQPKLTPPYDFMRSVLVGTTSPFPGFSPLQKRPLPIYPDEQLAMRVINATAEANLLGLFLASGKATQADLDRVNPTHSLMGYTDTDCVAGTWVNAVMVWDEALPSGRYAIVGMKGAFAGAGNGLARLVLVDCSWHPGVLMNIQTADRVGSCTAVCGLMESDMWPLMPDISFDNVNLPAIQLCSGIANTDAEFELLLQKIK